MSQRLFSAQMATLGIFRCSWLPLPSLLRCNKMNTYGSQTQMLKFVYNGWFIGGAMGDYLMGEGIISIGYSFFTIKNWLYCSVSYVTFIKHITKVIKHFYSIFLICIHIVSKQQFQSHQYISLMSKAEFKVLELLGKGSYGSVYRVVRLQDGLQYALKVVPFHTLTPKQKKNALNEVRVLASIKHPNIIQYHQAFFDEVDEELCLVMQLVDGGDLKNIIKGKRMGREQFYQYQIWNMGHEILKGIHQLHTNSIIHRDIKPSNILCNKSNPKISDFNISTQVREDLARTQIGTPYYSAPEIWDNESYAYECDVWSFGCLLYQMCCLDVPFQHKNIKLLYQAVRKCQFEEIPARFSVLMRKVMRMCICKRERRASVRELLKLFEKYVAPKPQSSLFTEKVPLLDPISIPTTVSDIKNSLPNPKYSQPQPQTPMNILDKFMKKVSDKPQYLSLVSSEKSLKPRKQSSQKTVKKTPSFMKAVKERSHYGIPVYERFSLERLSMGRRKLPLMMRLDY